MAVGPGSMLSAGRARVVEQAGLGQQHKRAFSVPSSGRRELRLGNLLERASDVYGSGPRTIGITPGDRPVERPIQLEDTGAVSISRQRLPVGSGESVAGNRKQAS